MTLFREHGAGGRALGGGTDLVVQVKEGVKIAPPAYLVSLRRLPELRGIDFDEATGLRIGAGVTMSELVASPVIRERYRAIADGAGIVGSLQTMNMATIGGNVCNAAPSADTSPPLLAHEAVAVVVGPEGEREVPLDELWLGPNDTSLSAGEIVREFRIPPTPPNAGGIYVRHTPRKQMDIAAVGVAVLLTLDDRGHISRARIALGAVGPVVFRAVKAEAALEGSAPDAAAFSQAAELAGTEASPISDKRGSAEFRRYLTRVMVERCLREAAARARGATA